MRQNEKMKNPANKRNVITWTIISIAFFGFGVVFLSFATPEAGILTIAIITGSVAFILFYIGAGYEEIKRPQMVEITDTGVILYQKLFRKPVILRWDDILCIAIARCDDPEKLRRWVYYDGNLNITEKKYYQIKREVLIEIKERYNEHMGHYPWTNPWNIDTGDK